MFYLAEDKVSEEMIAPDHKTLSSLELDDFKYQIGDIVYRVTDSLSFKVLKVEKRWRGTTSTFRSRRHRGERKCYQVKPTNSSYTHNQYETALFRTKEEAFIDRFLEEKGRAIISMSDKRLHDKRLHELEILRLKFT
jgi:hypothetical protein